MINEIETLGTKWNVDVVKAIKFEQFKQKVDHYIKKGKMPKVTDSEIRKAYEKITGEKLVNVEPNKK